MQRLALLSYPPETIRRHLPRTAQKHREGIDLIKRSLQIDPEWTDGYMVISGAYYKLGISDSAIWAIRIAIDQRPEVETFKTLLKRYESNGQ